MTRILRLIPALGAFFVAAILVAGCGDSVPGNAVASVDGSPVSRTAFAHWMGVAAAVSQQGGAKVAYNPPAFTACVASKRKTAPKPAKGQPATTDAQLKAQCKQEYEQLRDQVMEFLVIDKWINGEAKAQGIKVSNKTLEADFQKAVKQSYPKPADFQAFLKSSGMTVADARFQTHFNTIYGKLRDKAVKSATTVSPKEIQAFYNKNKARLGTPLTRDLRVVLTRDKSKADQAKAALQSGQKWTTVVKRFSIDPATKGTGGVLSGLSKGQQEKSFDDAIFSAPLHKLTGPIKTQFGYYVFQVQKETPATQQSLKQATPAIKQQLIAQNKQKAADAFNTQLRKKWKGKTNCRSGFIMRQCKNAPKETTTTAAAGAPVQQAPTQQAPTPQPSTQP